METEKRLLVIDDEADIIDAIEQSLRNFNLRIDRTQSPQKAIEMARQTPYQIIITDLKMQPIAGMELIKQIKQFSPQTEFVIITGYASYDSALEALKLGVFDYLEKPFSPEEIRLVIKNLCRTIDLSRENKQLKKLLIKETEEKRFIGQGAVYQQLKTVIEKVAPTDATVLLLGESGTGKEVLAREIHRLSKRRDEPFVVCNCAALPETLIESELFGSEAGAFTGAKKSRRGSFELAHGGTIFLDEIGEMPLNIQAKFLRVLENQEIKRLGAEQSQRVDVRIIAATNRDLELLVQKGQFREDLFYRLNIINIKIPPLKERKEDIPLLADFFVHQLSQKMGKTTQGLSPQALNVLMEYHWPGNVRELKNAIERAVILSDSAQLTENDFQFLHRAKQLAEPEQTHAWVQDLPLMPLDQLEQVYIRHVLEKLNHNQSQAARTLGISPATLWRHLKKQ